MHEEGKGGLKPEDFRKGNFDSMAQLGAHMGAISAQLSSWSPIAGHMPNIQTMHHHHHHHNDPHDIRSNILCGIKTFAEGQDASSFLHSIIN